MFDSEITYDSTTPPTIGIGIRNDGGLVDLGAFTHLLTETYGLAKIHGVIKRISATSITANFSVQEFSEDAGVFLNSETVYPVDSRMLITTMGDLENNPFSIFLRGNCDSADMTGRSEIVYVPKK